MNPLCIALSVRTDFSIGESSLQVPRLVELAQAQGYSHVALCDLMSVSAMPLFVEKAKKAGITPLIGATLHLVDDPTARIKDKDGNNPVRIKAFPTSERGMRSLFRTLSLALTPERFYYHGRLSLDDVLQLEDVLVTTGDVRSLWHHPNAEDLASRLHARFGDALWVEFSAQDTPLFDQLNRRAAKWAADREVNRLVSRPTYYATDEDADSADVLRAITSNTDVNSKWLARPWLRDLSLCAPRDMAAHCKALVERVPEVGPARALLDGVAVFAERCTYRFEKQPPCLPKMADNEFAALVKACTEGWKERFTRQVWGHMPTPEELATTYKERLRYELEVIKKMGFSGYFLLVQDIVRWAKANKVMVGPGRGSVGGSLVAYLMGITDCDPIRFNLLFERFINPDRVDLPDADLDFMSGRRHLVIDYIQKKYGREYVAGIVNFSTLGPSSAIRDVSRVHGLQPWEYDCSKQVEKEHGVSLSLSESVERVPDIEKFRDAHPHIWNHALRVEGANRSLGQHAAGVIVAGAPIAERAVVSTRHSEDGALPVVQFDKRAVEDFGLIKIDVLGLNTLDLIVTALEYIEERDGKTIDVLSLPLDDPKVLDAFGRGDTTGVFQFDGAGMKKLLKDMAQGGRLSFEDIAAATALFRPGPLDAGLCDRYVRIKQGAATPHYEHPALEKCLKDTYGVIIYQEQVMSVARELSGFTPGEADHLRKAIGKKDAEKMAQYGDKFVAGAVNSGMSEERAKLLWAAILNFASYSFNRSHSVEYSLISWITMWLKVYHPAAFFAAAMTVIEKEEKLASLVEDAQSRYLHVLPPDLNISTDRIVIRGEDKLYAPFQSVKGISSATAAAIVKLREAAGGRFALGADGEATGLHPDVQKAVLGRTVVTSRARENLRKVGAYHSLDPASLPPMHPDRLRDRIELMPGFTVDIVKPDRELSADGFAKTRIIKLVSEYRACEGCDLKGQQHPQVRMGDKPKFMLVFDSPDWKDCHEGRLLEGKNGEVVKAALKGVGLRVADGYYTSLVKGDKPREQKQLTNGQINGCTEWLKREIEILKPPVIIAMGSAATRWLLPETKGMKSADLAGRAFFRKDLDATVIAGLNPGMLFHDPAKIKIVEAVFQRLADLLNP